MVRIYFQGYQRDITKYVKCRKQRQKHVMIRLTMIQMMSGVKQLKDLQVLWILYYRNQTLLRMVIKF